MNRSTESGTGKTRESRYLPVTCQPQISFVEIQKSIISLIRTQGMETHEINGVSERKSEGRNMLRIVGKIVVGEKRRKRETYLSVLGQCLSVQGRARRSRSSMFCLFPGYLFPVWFVGLSLATHSHLA